MSEYDWYDELDQYTRVEEVSQAERAEAWMTAIGLQAVDGLKTSDYLLETAKDHIEGRISMSTAKERIESYYNQRQHRQDLENNAHEADTVSARITELINTPTFHLSPVTLKSIHKHLFSGVFDHAGQFRSYNISKNEWVLNGASVSYASFNDIAAALNYDFERERNFSYAGLPINEAVKHLAQFASGIWQIHPFCEGNTRTTAVFMILYLKTFGFRLNNEVFMNHSWFFRNALVRANFNDLQQGISETTSFLEAFFQNLLLSTNHPLNNRTLHILAQNQCAGDDTPKCKNCTLEELVIIRALKENPHLTQKELATLIDKSERTVKSRMAEMQEKGMIQRQGGKRQGSWQVLVSE
jgi:fido (protein-threonine AMPylation protein)